MKLVSYIDYLTLLFSKFRLDPFCFDLYGQDILIMHLENDFESEWRGIKESEGSGHTPCYITHEVQRQSKEEDPYPEGVVRIVAMTKIEGIPIEELEHPELYNGQLTFTAEEVEGFWQQIVYVAEYAIYSVC